MGDVVYAQLPDIGSEIKKEGQKILKLFKVKIKLECLIKINLFTAECGALESVKAASELFSPVSGKVVEKNEAVEKTPSLINTSCYEKGWLFKVELSKPDELKSLMNEEAYNLYLKSDPS